MYLCDIMDSVLDSHACRGASIIDPGKLDYTLCFG